MDAAVVVGTRDLILFMLPNGPQARTPCTMRLFPCSFPCDVGLPAALTWAGAGEAPATRTFILFDCLIVASLLVMLVCADAVRAFITSEL